MLRNQLLDIVGETIRSPVNLASQDLIRQGWLDGVGNFGNGALNTDGDLVPVLGGMLKTGAIIEMPHRLAEIRVLRLKVIITAAGTECRTRCIGCASWRWVGF